MGWVEKRLRLKVIAKSLLINSNSEGTVFFIDKLI